MPEAITPPATTGDLAVLVLQRNATDFLEHAPGARAGTDPHHVHQMRVATRRLRAALRLFGDILPPQAASLSEELKWFAGQLGPVRDLDVQIQRVGAIAGELGVLDVLEPYAGWLQSQLERARAKLAKAFESRRFGALVQRLQRLDEWAPEASTSPSNPRSAALHGAGAPLFEDAPRRLQRAYRQLRKRADVLVSESPAPELHAVRIRAKRLRYTAEFFEIAYGKPAQELVARVVTLQDLLGHLQDGVVSREQIHAAVHSSEGAWPAETSLALGQMMQYEAEREKEFRAEFPSVYRALKTKGWQRLLKAAKKAS